MTAVRPAEPDDVPGIRRVARASWYAAHEPIVGSAAVESFLADYYDAETLREQVADDETVFRVAAADGIVGLATAGPRDEPGVFGLGRIYVAPDRWGEGSGTRLLEGVVETVRERGGERLRLIVMAGNERAVSFYEARGFERVGDHYDDRLDVEGYVYVTEL